MYGYVYITTNLTNNKKYIGQHKGQFNKSYLGSGLAIKNAIKKYGKDNFSVEIVCECRTKEDLDKKEIEIIQLYNAVKSQEYYNQVDGGRGGVIYERRDGVHNPFFGRKQSEEYKKRLSDARKGVPRPREVVEKWSKTQRGKKLTEDHKAKLMKSVSVKNVLTGEVISFDSNNSAMLYLKCSNPTFYRNKRLGLLWNKTFLILKEDA